MLGHVTEEALQSVRYERSRQEDLKAEGRFKHTLADYGLTYAERLACIVEEVGEVGRNVLARNGVVTDGDASPAALYKELSQVAALSVAWMEHVGQSL
jgi:hypothetical protein